MRYVIYEYRYLVPEILEDATNRHILARHLGVDALSCFFCAYFGWQGRKIWENLLFAAFDFSGKKSSGAEKEKKKDGKNDVSSYMPRAGYMDRMFSYHPIGYQCSIFFFWYQVKNLFDTIAWNDGPVYIAHHVLSMLTALGGMYPGCAHLYALFFFGLSEVSTGVLCVLANFDDDHGVKGLGDALPDVKVVLGISFAILFIICRCILWPIFSYYFVRDIQDAFNAPQIDPRTEERRYWFYWFRTSLTSLSVLQIAWLGEIFFTLHSELTRMGYLK